MRIIKFLSIVVSIFLSTNTLAINFLWNGSQNTQWTNSSNWTPNGVPATTDSVRIVTTSKHPQLQSNVTIKRLTMTSGTLNLNGYTLYVTNESRYPGGTITNGTLNLRGTSVYFEGASLNCSIDAILGLIYFNGSVFNQTSSFEQTGTTSGWGTGGNTFNANVTIKNAGTAYLRLGNNNPDVFNGTTNLKNTGAYPLQIGFGSAVTFNGNLIVENTGGGIAFGTGTSSGAAILSSSKTITVGSGGFSSGTLTLMNFTQQGNTSQSLTATGTAIINVVGSTFNGATVITSPGVLTKTSNFNSSFELIKTGTSSNFSDGGNTYNGATIIRNNASNGASIRLALQTGDVFNSNVSFITTTGNIQIAYAGTTEFKGNISLNSSLAYFNVGSGTVKFSGSANQQLNGTINYLFNKVEVNKTAGDVTLNSTASIDTSLNLVKGIIKTSSTNLLTLKAGSTTTGGNNTSFISGPLRKIGNTVYSFPVGKNNVIRRFEVGTLSASNESIIVEYFPSTPTNFANIDTSLIHINRCEYWSVSHPVGSSSFSAKCSWNSRSCDIAVNGNMVITSWDGTKWKNLGKSNLTGDVLVGSLSSSVNSNNVSYTTAIIKNSINNSVVKPNLLSEFAIYSRDSIYNSDLIFANGKVGASWIDSTKISSADSVIINFSGSTYERHESFKNLFSQIACLKDTTFNPFTSNNTILPKYYNIVGDVIINSLFTLTDTNNLYVFKISGKLTLSSNGIVNINKAYFGNIIWMVDTIENDNQNSISGVIISKNNLILNHTLLGNFSLLSMKNIYMANVDNVFHTTFVINSTIQDVVTPCGTFTFDGCNYVTNSGFDASVTTPQYFNNMVPYSVNNVCAWYAPSIPIGDANTAEYFNDVAIPAPPFNLCLMCVPQQQSLSGNISLDHSIIGGGAYSGLLAFYSADNDYHEFITNELVDPLPVNTTYYGEFFVMLHDGSYSSVNSIGMDLTDFRPTLKPDILPQTIVPEINYTGTNLIDTLNWTRVSGCFTSPTNLQYQFATIGNFNLTQNSNVALTGTFGAPGAYYLIDDVSTVQFKADAGVDRVVSGCGTSILGNGNCLTDLDNGLVPTNPFIYTWTLISGNPAFSSLTSTSILHPTIINTNFTPNSATVKYRLTITTTSSTPCSVSDDVDIVLTGCCNLTSSLTATPTCSNTGTCTITRTGGTGTINYVISPGNITGSFTTTTFTRGNLVPGTYSILLTDANGCTSSNNFTIALQTVPTIKIIGAIYECSANDNYSVSNPVPGVNYSYEIIPINGPTITNSGSSVDVTSSMVSNGTFTIIFISNLGTSCEKRASLTVYECCEGMVNANDPTKTLTWTDRSVTDIIAENLASIPAFSLYNGYFGSTDPVATLNIGYLSNRTHFLAINGTLTVDRDLSIMSSHIYLGPGAKIIVKSGFKLFLDNVCYLHSCGSYMWQGIIIENGASLEAAGGRTVIEDAIIAVDVNDGGTLKLKGGVVFNKNNISINVKPSFSSSISIIKNSFFCYSNYFNVSTASPVTNPTNGLITLPPYANKKSSIGIKLNNVTSNNLRIGDLISPLGTPYGANHFRNLDYGINAIRSDFTVVNSIFEDIVNQENSSQGTNDRCANCILSPEVGTAILNDGSGRLVSQLTVGGYEISDGVNIASNIFKNCKRGVYTKGSINSTISYNKFEVITFTACDHFNAKDKFIQIDHNDFITCNRGVQIINSFALNTNQSVNPFINISDNVYDYSGSFQITGPGGLRKWFVNIENAPSILPTSFVVRDNSILQPYTGVRTSLVGGRGILAQINNNVIGLQVSTPSRPYYGIQIIGSGQVKVLENSIGKQGGDPTVTRPFGISIETSDDLTLNSNTMYKTGTGIRAFNSISPSVLQCNYMDLNWHGIRYENSDLGNQGSITQPSDNQWVNGVSLFDIVGVPDFLNLTNWWVRDNSNTTTFSTSNVSPVITPFPQVFQQVSPIPTSTCTNPCIGPYCRNTYFADVITEQGNYASLDIENQYLAKTFVYKALEADSSIYNSGASTDSLFEAFYDSMKIANAGLFDETTKLLSQNDYTNASTIINSITPENNSEYNQKIVNEIYSATWAREIYEFTTSQYNQLFDIANQNPISGGIAVYAARVMLDIDIDDEISSQGARIGKNILDTKEDLSSNLAEKLVLYPNPATNFVTLSNMSGNELNGRIEITNSLGSIVYTSNVVNVKSIEISTQSFSSGIYYLLFRNKNSVNVRLKVIILD
jgi:hypothetical protein